MRTVLVVAGVVAAGVVLGAPELVGLDAVTPLVQLTAARVPVLVVALPIALLVVLGTRAHRAGPALVLVLLLVAAGFVAPRQIASELPPAGALLRVLSLNVDNGQADVPALAALLRAVRPDLVVLPEAGDRFAGALVAAVPELSYRAHVGGPPGLADGLTVTLLTAPPLVGDTVDRDGARFAWVRVGGGSMPAVVDAVHAAAPVVGQTQRWTADMAALTGPCRSGRPVILAGDLNATEDNARFRRMAAGCQDAVAARGHGLTATWPSWSPTWWGMQIDHVLLGGGLVARDAAILAVPGTDHRAVLVTVATSGGAVR